MHYPPSKFSIPSNNIIINYISLLYTFFFLLTMGRPPCCDKANVKRGPWTKEEDAKILAHVASHGIGNWTLVPQKAGLNRCGKSCRLRWTNYLRPDLKHDGFTQEEEECILEMHRTIGSRWSLIARRLPGRTDNDVKNYWNTKLKKKLIKMGIDPITHKPFSQLFSEYGQISGSNVNPFVRNPIGLRVQENDARKIGHFVMNQEDFQEPCLFSEASYDGSDAMRFGCGISCSFEGSREAFTGDEYILGGPEMEGRNEFSGVKGDGDGDGSGDSGKIVESCFYGSGDSGKNTFVEEILARDMEMRIQFPEFCSENYDY